MSTQNRRHLNSMRENLARFHLIPLQNVADSTLDGYRRETLRFGDWLDTKGIRTIKAVKARHIEDYVEHLRADGYAQASVSRNFMAIRAFFSYLVAGKMLKENPCAGLKPPRVENKPARVITLEELEKLLAAPNVESEAGLRDRAVMELLYCSGLRVSELCDLQLSDYFGTHIRIRKSKTDMPRTIPVSEKARHWIDLYVTKDRGKESGYLFCTLARKALRRTVVARIIEQHAKNAGIEKVTPHTLRHACATHFLEAGADILFIKELLGHSDIRTTQRYTHLSSHKMQVMYNKFNPRKEI